MTCRKSIVALLLAASPLMAQAADVRKYGYGAETCGHYVSTREGFRKGSAGDRVEVLMYLSCLMGLLPLEAYNSLEMCSKERILMR